MQSHFTLRKETMALNWRRAFLKQAISDLRVATEMAKRENVEDCHRIRYLQMAAEKFAKGFQTSGQNQPPTIHPVFDRFVRTLRNNPRRFKGLSEIVAAKPLWNRTQYLKRIVRNATRLVNLIPKKSGGPNSEYPWLARDNQGNETVAVPCEFKFGVPYDISYSHLLEFLNLCERAAQGEII